MIKRVLLAALPAVAIMLAPAAHADNKCSPYWWYQVCETSSGQWSLCNFNHDGQCYNVPTPPGGVPGLPDPQSNPAATSSP